MSKFSLLLEDSGMLQYGWDRPNIYSSSFDKKSSVLIFGCDCNYNGIKNVVSWKICAQKTIDSVGEDVDGYMECLMEMPEGYRLTSVDVPQTDLIKRGRLRYDDVDEDGYWVTREVEEIHPCYVRYSPDDTFFVSANLDGTIRIFDPKTNKQTYSTKLHDTYITGLAVHPNSITIASAGSDGTVKTLNMMNKEVKQICDSSEYVINALEYSPDGKLLVGACSNGSMLFWDISKGYALTRTKVHKEPIKGVSISKDGSLMLTITSRKVLLWDFQRRGVITVIEPPASKATFLDGDISIDNKYAALSVSGNGDSILFFDIRLNKLIDEYRLCVRNTDERVSTVKFSPNGLFLVATMSNMIYLWDISYNPPKTVRTKVVGASYFGNNADLVRLEKGMSLELERESENAFDKNAILVTGKRYRGPQEPLVKLGYLPRYVAALLATSLDYGVKYNATINNLLDGDIFVTIEDEIVAFENWKLEREKTRLESNMNRPDDQIDSDYFGEYGEWGDYGPD